MYLLNCIRSMSELNSLEFIPSSTRHSNGRKLLFVSKSSLIRQVSTLSDRLVNGSKLLQPVARTRLLAKEMAWRERDWLHISGTVLDAIHFHCPLVSLLDLDLEYD